jgi:putative glutamine amidotransferase
MTFFRPPIIGCTTYRKTADQEPPIEILGLMPSYVNAIVAAGGVPVLIPLGLSEVDLLAIFERIDGLLLPGGGDVDPAEYQAHAPELANSIDLDRDRVELLLARTAVAQQKPMLAICRGIQVLNVALGGTLYEDIFELMPGALRHDNYGKRPRNYLAHNVTIQPGSLLARQLGKGETAVNSLHHQGIHRLAPELCATALAPDGLIEAVEVPNHPFALGIQWHPENLIHDDPAMLALFKGLVAAASEQ